MKTPSLIAKNVATAAAATVAPQHSHSHGHGGHAHAHSHGAIEKNISGKLLRQCQTATLAGGATNVFFCASKLWIGSAGGSVALVADGFHALTDILADIISYVAISLSRKKLPRCRFPFGIGRLETSGAVLVAGILFFGGVALLVQSVEQCVMDVSKLLEAAVPTGGIAAALAITVRQSLAAVTGNTSSSSKPDETPSTTTAAATDSEKHPLQDNHVGSSSHQHSHSHSHSGGDGGHGHSHFEVMEYDQTTGKQVIMWTMVIVAATSVVCKELLFRWTRRVGQRAGSRVVVANAYHHRADAWSGAVALVGVAGQLIGLPGIDGLAGLVVSLSICQIGYGLFRDAILEFFDFQDAEEVRLIREQLQKFNLRIVHGTDVVPMRESDAVETAVSAAATAAETVATTTSDVASRSNSVITGDDPEAVNRKKISFMNVFLIRHGHKYALHVTLLVYESVSALQIREATDLLTALARGSLPVRDTFTNILVCSNHTVPREEYLGSNDMVEEEEAAGDYDGSTEKKKQNEDHGHTHGESSEAARTAGSGAIINASLERCIAALQEFHTFRSAIRYNWEDRTITAPTSGSCECDRDVASVAEMFRCRLISVPEGDTHGAAEAEHEGHGHSHGDEYTHHAH